MANELTLADAEALLSKAAQAYQAEHARMQRTHGGDGSFSRSDFSAAAFFAAAQEYWVAFEAALHEHPDGQAIFEYADAATAFAAQVKVCTAATVSALDGSQLETTKEMFAWWRECEQKFVQLGYRAVPFSELQDSVAWPGASKKLHFLIYSRFLVRRDEGEQPVLETDKLLSHHPQLG